MSDVQNPVFLSKKELRARGWSARDIKTLLVPSGVRKGTGRGRPSFTYALSDVELIEQQGEQLIAEADSAGEPVVADNFADDAFEPAAE